MIPNKKTMLIIEDNKDLQETLIELCQDVHRRLYDDSEGKIIKASSVDEAKSAINNNSPIHFASVDLNLEGDKTGTDTPSGFQILEEIHIKKLNTVSIVLSGEFNPDFSGMSKRYGVLTFQRKTTSNYVDIYLQAVEAALLYADALEFFDKEDFKGSLKKWREAQDIAESIKVKDWSFPIDIEKEYQNRFKHPATRLPTSQLIEDEYAKLMKMDAWLLFYIEISYWEALNESQGRSQAIELLKATKHLLNEAILAHNLDIGFLGQVSDEVFVLVSKDTSIYKNSTKIKAFIKDIQTRFDKDSPVHYDNKTKERGTITYRDKNGNMKETASLAFLNVVFGRGRGNDFAIGRLTETGDIIYDEFEFHDIRDIDKTARQALRQQVN